MIPPELRAEIRRLHYAEHWPVNTIARALDVHHETVQRAIERFVRTGAQLRPSVLDPYKALIAATLEQYCLDLARTLGEEAQPRISAGAP